MLAIPYPGSRVEPDADAKGSAEMRRRVNMAIVARVGPYFSFGLIVACCESVPDNNS